jgi:hydroxymethylbilane synthase
MALFQAELVRARLRAVHAELADAAAVELVPIRTTGDRVQNRRLAEIGGKGLFTKEIEEALLDNRIDLAMHSLKDMETFLPPGLEIGCVLERDDPRDVLVSRDGLSLDDLPDGARIGTASLRRRAQLLQRRPDLEVPPIRGNVGTRIGKMQAGEVDALVLALCGLERLHQMDLVSEILPIEVMLPAVGQGVVAVECRVGDADLARLLAPLNHRATAACVIAERAMLAALDGSCRTPIAGLATIVEGELVLDALLLSPDGDAERRGRIAGMPEDAAALGKELGDRLRRDAGPEFGFDDPPPHG